MLDLNLPDSGTHEIYLAFGSDYFCNIIWNALGIFRIFVFRWIKEHLGVSRAVGDEVQNTQSDGN